MSRGAGSLTLQLVVVAALVGAVVGFGLGVRSAGSVRGEGLGQRAPPVRQAPEAPAIQVSILGVRMTPAFVELREVGTVRAWRRTNLSAEIAGRVRSVGYGRGERVGAAAFVELDDEARQIALRGAEGKAGLLDSRIALLKRQVLRLRALAAGATEAELDQRRSALEAAGLERSLAEIEIARVKRELKATSVRAPRGSVIIERRVEPGEMVAPGQALGVAIDLSRVRVELPISARQYPLMRELAESAVVSSGTELRLSFPDLGLQRPARVLRVVPAAASGSGRYLAILEAANSDGKLVDGLMAVVRLRRGTGAVECRIPRRAVTGLEGRRVVYVLEGERVRARPVRILAERGGELVVSGLESGLELVDEGAALLRPGARVQRVKQRSRRASASSKQTTRKAP